MPRHLISDAHEWINEIPTVPIYYLAKPQPREWAWQNQRGKKTLNALRFVPTTSINGVNSGQRAASPAASTVVGGCGRDNLVRGSLRGGLRPLYGNPVASLLRGAVVTRGKVSVGGREAAGLRDVLNPGESLPVDGAPTAQSLRGPYLHDAWEEMPRRRPVGRWLSLTLV